MQIILINGARKQEFNHLGIFGRLQNNLDFCPSMQWDCELTAAVLCNITELPFVGLVTVFESLSENRFKAFKPPLTVDW